MTGLPWNQFAQFRNTSCTSALEGVSLGHVLKFQLTVTPRGLPFIYLVSQGRSLAYTVSVVWVEGALGLR